MNKSNALLPVSGTLHMSIHGGWKKESNLALGWDKTGWILPLNTLLIGLWKPSSPFSRADTDTVSSVSESKEEERKAVRESRKFQMNCIRQTQSRRFRLRDDISQSGHQSEKWRPTGDKSLSVAAFDPTGETWGSDHRFKPLSPLR